MNDARAAGSGDEQQELDLLAAEVGAQLACHGLLLATAESCTGGWLAQCLTAIAGSSQWFERGFVTYSNVAKQEMLGVEAETLLAHGAVSEATACAMARGALKYSRADWALAITGVAGPSGGLPEKPVGTVCFAWAGPEGRCETEVRYLQGDRATVRRQSVEHALRGILQRTGTLQA